MRTFAGSNEVEESELEGLARIAAEFFEMLALVRPELNAATPHAVRDGTLASAGVMMHGYAALMREFNLDIARLGSSAARDHWQRALAMLGPDVNYRQAEYSGDFLGRTNPLWQQLGIARLDPSSGRVQVSNTGGSRRRAGDALVARVIGQDSIDLGGRDVRG